MRSVLKRREASRLFALWAFDRVRAVWTFIAFMSNVSSRDRRVRSHLCLNEQPDWFLPNSKMMTFYEGSLNLIVSLSDQRQIFCSYQSDI